MLQAVGDARLDDVDVVLVQLEDALAVLLEGRVVLSGGGHAADCTAGGVTPVVARWVHARHRTDLPGADAKVGRPRRGRGPCHAGRRHPRRRSPPALPADPGQGRGPVADRRRRPSLPGPHRQLHQPGPRQRLPADHRRGPAGHGGRHQLAGPQRPRRRPGRGDRGPGAVGRAAALHQLGQRGDDGGGRDRPRRHRPAAGADGPLRLPRLGAPLRGRHPRARGAGDAGRDLRRRRRVHGDPRRAGRGDRRRHPRAGDGLGRAARRVAPTSSSRSSRPLRPPAPSSSWTRSSRCGSPPAARSRCSACGRT